MTKLKKDGRTRIVYVYSSGEPNNRSENRVTNMSLLNDISINSIFANTPVKHKKRGFFYLSVWE